MTTPQHDYLASILKSQELLPQQLEELRATREKIEGDLRRGWLGSLPRFYYGGSYGKLTMVRDSYDLDLVIYFPANDSRALRQIYESVQSALINSRYLVEPKTVALRLPYRTAGSSSVRFHVDVVPARAQDHDYNYATLYKNGENTTMQTSLRQHIKAVRDAGLSDVVKLLKLWRNQHGVQVKTFVLEILVARAMYNQRRDDLWRQMRCVLEFISANIANVRLVDPANSNNIVDVSPATRAALRDQADLALNRRTMGEIIR